MGTGEGAYSWHAYSTASNALGAAGFFLFYFQDSTFWTTCSAMTPHRRYKTQEGRQSNTALWNSQVVSISSNITVSQFRGLRLVRTCHMVYNIFFIALIVSFGWSKQPSYKQCIALVYFLHHHLFIYMFIS